MKVLLINKFYYIKGGSETYYFALKKLLEEKGHEVIDFSMLDEKNFDSKYSEYFVENVDYNKKQSMLKKTILASRIIYSFEAKVKLERLLDYVKPDVAHLQIFQHQLSPSIISVLKKRNIAIVYTAHDLKMICPNYKMLSNGIVCEKCIGEKYINCYRNKCVKNSSVKSIINVTEAYIHKWLKSYKKINTIITPSEFYRNKFIEFGVDKQKVEYIPNFINCNSFTPTYCDEKYLLYFGRVSEEKGILTLVKAIEKVKCKIKIVGTGPLSEEIKSYISENNISEYVEMVGYKQGEELMDIIKNSTAVIVPSEWYENAPYSVLESMAFGKVILGANIGGIKELTDGTGISFKSGDINDLAVKIKYILNNNHKINILATNSRKVIEEKFNSDIHYKRIMEVYGNAIENNMNLK